MSDSQSPEDLLQSALSSAFTPVSIAPTPPTLSSAPTPAETQPSASSASSPAPTAPPLVSQSELAKHEEERAALERSWREQSAIERRAAEERRARIATERAASGETWETLEAGKELVGPHNVGYPGESSPVDGRDIVSGEPSGSRHVETSGQTSLEHSQRWEEIEDVPSMESSYPSLSFPSQSQSHSASSSEHAPHPSSKKPKSNPTSKPSQSPSSNPPPSTTLSIFDPRLPPRARLIALFSSLSINLLLPFVNGVMLGFGEIFARNMASRFFGFGSKVPGPGGAATAVGVGAVGSSKRR